MKINEKTELTLFNKLFPVYFHTWRITAGTQTYFFVGGPEKLPEALKAVQNKTGIIPKYKKVN